MNRNSVARACTAVVFAAGLAAVSALPATADAPDTQTQAERVAAATASMNSLDARATSAPDAVTSWYVDGDTVVMSATDTKVAKNFVRQMGLDPATVRVEWVADRPVKYLSGGDAIYTGGARCSAGFNSTNGSANFVITAGHCTNIGSTWNNGSQTIGTVAGSSFPGNDYGIIRVTNAAIPLPGNVTGIGPVRGSNLAPVGSSVCRSGSTTGVRCGNIQARGVTVNYGSSGIVYDLTQTTACAEPGDSGGPYMTGDQAQGLTSGGSGNCRSGGTTFYQEIREVLGVYGLRLITS